MKEKDKVFCVDQGGGNSQVNVTENQSPTLTTTHGGEPVVCLEGNGSRESHLGDGYKESDIMYTLNTVEQHAVCYGIDQQGGKGMAGYGIDVSPTLASESHGTPHAVAIVPNEPILLESNQNHATIQTDGISTTLSASMGMGGGYVPMIVDHPIVFEPGAASRVGGHVYEDEITGTLRAEAGDNQPTVVYGISAYDSNAMKSDNPHSGIYIADTSRTLDLNGGNPGCNQGGMMVVEPQTFRKSSHARTSDEGQGWEETEVNDTLNIFDNGETRTPTLIAQPMAFTQNVREEVRDLGDKSGALSAESGIHQQTYVLENHPNDSRLKISEDNVFQTLSGRMGTGGNNTPMVMENCSWDGGQISPTLTANNANDAQRMPDKENFNAILGFDSYNLQDTGDVGRCLSAAGGGINEHAPCVYENDNNQYKGDTTMKQTAIVRRLTPTECSRLQGMPDGWCDIGEWVDEKGKKHKDADAPKYKALGNGIALPFWQWLAYRITDQLKADGVENPTLFSMFDGIGSFCLAFKRAGCEPVAVSEIEPYPIAVCKKHFGDEDLGITGDIDKYV